jgi:hypothetical protein
MTIENEIECSHCNCADKIEKVSTIVNGGFSTEPSENTEPLEWAGKTYYIHYQQRNLQHLVENTHPKGKKARFTIQVWGSIPKERITLSPLASRLLPKIEKPDISWPSTRPLKMQLAGLLVGSLVLTLTGIMRRIITLVIIGIIALGSIATAGSLGYSILQMGKWFVNREQQEYSQKMSKKAEAEEKWQKLYYCYRCEEVFSQDSNFIPVYKLDQYLFDLPDIGTSFNKKFSSRQK